MGRPSVIPKAKYMTLGPEFYTKLVLLLQKYRTQKMLQIPLKIIDLQNNFNIWVAKQWKIKISVPMSYISLWE